MKYVLTILLFVSFLTGYSQTMKDEKEIITKTQLLSKTVFGTKDSATLDNLLAVSLNYGHSGGKTEDKGEAMNGIINNKSVYSDTVLKDMYVLFSNKNTALVRYIYDAKETKVDGSTGQLKFFMLLVWIREDDHWKLFVRQAIKRP